MRAFVINLVVAIIWVLLQAEPTMVVFATGWIVGFALLVLFGPIIGSQGYVRRAFGVGRYAVVFLAAFVASCWQLIAISLTRPVRRLQPRIITYDVRGLTQLEVLLLSHSISLTPGTTTIDIDAARGRLVLHALDAPDPEELRRGIDRTLRRGILAFTR